MNFRCLPFLVLPALFALPAALAATGGADVDDADTIIVTASRSPLKMPEVGSSTTIITRQQIEVRQARYVVDMLRAVPGFAVSQSGPQGSQTQVRVRGAEANHVLVLIDGNRANDPAGGDEFRWEYLTTANVERIEIIRGPQTVLWGSDALSAVVNVITQDIGGSEPSMHAYAEGGSFASRNLGMHGNIGGSNWTFGFGLERLKSDGTNVSRTGSEKDGSEVQTASVNARIDASELLTFDFGVRAVDAYADIDPIDFFVTGLPVDGDLANDGKRLYARTSARLGSPGGTVTQRLHFNYLSSDNRNLVAGEADAEADADRRTVGYQLDLKLAENVLSLAAESEITEFRQRGEVIFGDPNQDQEMTVNSLIADYQYRATDAMTWLMSVRYDDSSDFDDVLTGRIAASWQLRDATRVYFNAATGQKAPTFTERFGYFQGQFVGNPGLKPEQSTSYEIGLERLFDNERLNLGLALFRQDLRDEINGFVFDPVTFLATAENSTADSRRQGLEVSAFYHVGDNLRLDASYTYTDSTVRTSATVLDEIRRPRHSGSASLSYAFLEHRGSLFLAADYGGTRTDTFFPPFPAPPATVMLDHHWLVDLTLGFDVTERLNLFVRAANLLDEDYEQVFGFQTPGRSAYLGIRAAFEL